MNELLEKIIDENTDNNTGVLVWIDHYEKPCTFGLGNTIATHKDN